MAWASERGRLLCGLQMTGKRQALPWPVGAVLLFLTGEGRLASPDPKTGSSPRTSWDQRGFGLSVCVSAVGNECGAVVQISRCFVFT